MRKQRRLIVVSNRLPPVSSDGEIAPRRRASAGGLVAALDPVLRRSGGTWIGWNGVVGRAARTVTSGGVDFKGISLSQGELNGYYHGFSNRTLWPLFHDSIRPPQFRHETWRPYVEINRRFARAAVRGARRGDMVWVHDYHLMLVPAMIREMNPDLKIGFFLHIPFPPEELFEWLPWRRELLEGLLGADVVGFQTHQGARNFSRLARRYADADGKDALLRHAGRRVRVGAFPISIDFDTFDRMSREPRAIQRAAAIRSRIGPRRRILLAVDRLDYTKGIEERLLAFEELLSSGHASAKNTVLIQIAAPSRDGVREYEETRAAVEAIVGRINGDHSGPGRVAVHYFRRTHTRDEIVPYFLAADVMLVTPLRDGMNLVAKEFLATRSDGGGRLVLSEFAGAAEELHQAVLVNPRDMQGMAEAFRKALAMPSHEARFRLGYMRQRVRRHDVHEWAGDFLKELAA